MSVIPQLFYMIFDNGLVLFVLKIVDDLLLTSEKSDVEIFLDGFNASLSFGTVVHGTGVQILHEMTIMKADD